MPTKIRISALPKVTAMPVMGIVAAAEGAGSVEPTVMYEVYAEDFDKLAAGESSSDILAALGWYVPEGLSQMICTDISKDGMLQGPDFGFYVSLKEQWPTVDVTLSGGISCMDDLVKAEELGLHSVIVGKAIYEGKISLKELESWLLKG